MVPTQPSRSRIRLTHEIGGLSITIAARRNWGLLLFLGFWLCGWLMGESFALKMLIAGTGGFAAMLFLFVWLVLWTIGGAAAWLAFVGALTGEETIVVGQDAISVRRSVLGLGKARVVPMRSLRNLRAEAGTVWARRESGSLERGRIAVDLEEGGTVRFGVDLDDGEADYLVTAIGSEVRIPSEARPESAHALAATA